MDVIYWGTIYPTLAVLREMKARRYGRIVNVTSIGGKASIPHLLPYSGAKYAAVGFSQGLRAELAGSGVTVTTIVPGLMRTGSFLNAFARGQHAKEYAWFSLAASLPLLSMDASQAAKQIVEATRRGEAERTLGVPAQLLARLNGLFPGLIAGVNGLVNRLMPGPGSRERERGFAVHQQLPPRQRTVLSRLTALGWQGALRLNQLSPQERETVPDQEYNDGQGARQR
jgi:NAD(P)-dependent dehydrogenase (short-subunit alcohol dehydrogenase family)